MLDELHAGQLGPDVLKEAVSRAEGLATQLESGSGNAQRDLVVELVKKVMIGASSITIELKRAAIAARLLRSVCARVERS